ncbi:alpha/beta fold hydrolase [Phycicoccus sp. M110.8]|uniref:alpha/beta fold hydrolase n=1 Tax=Phycicoccus sp. M110.8 TaxID=3075433 RepID=UPI0028FD75A4|nr:alpha/beta fold hydrolase [Phycicoccus sp. M110.8]MDU0314186.1 alpha/beta fold hydrolase [Phycicoccus sp. M110.8]
MRELSRNGLTFDVSDDGPDDGAADPPVALLLHGWPQDRHAWSRVTPLLTAGGLRVVAFDQRGYSPRARPRGRAAYRMGELVADVVAAVDACGVQRVHLVGHDWGGAVAWAAAERHPERFASLTVLSTPHHRAFAAALRHLDQASHSWYMAAFQLPVLPELVLAGRLEGVLRRSGLPPEDARRYAARFREPGAAGGGLAWYRALPLGASTLSGLPNPLRRKASRDRAEVPDPGLGGHRITVPTTYLWGSHDPALGRRAAEASGDWVASDYRFVELDAGHWLPETRAQEVAAAVLSRAGGAPQDA